MCGLLTNSIWAAITTASIAISGLKRFAGLSWLEREKLLHILREAGVIWLQLTGGDPMINRPTARACQASRGNDHPGGLHHGP